MGQLTAESAQGHEHGFSARFRVLVAPTPKNDSGMELAVANMGARDLGDFWANFTALGVFEARRQES